MTNTKKLLLIFFIFIIVFGVFLRVVFFSDDPKRLVYDNLNNIENVDSIIAYYKSLSKDFQEQEPIKERLIERLRHKKISNDQIQEVSNLLNNPIYLNVVIVPDLSKRIIDTINNPNQSEYDRKLILKAYKEFIGFIISQNNYEINDKLSFDFTDPRQTNGKFNKLSDKLSIDFSKPNQNFTVNDFNVKEKEIENAITEIYQIASQPKNTIGNNFIEYFNTFFSSKLQKTTLEKRWVNKLIVLTDGYLEVTNSSGDIIDYTPVTKSPDDYPIPIVDKDYSNCDILICQVNMRKNERSKSESLKRYWYNWLSSMRFRNINDDNWWSKRYEDPNVAENELVDFFQGEVNTPNTIKNVESLSSYKNSTPASDIQKPTSNDRNAHKNVSQNIPKKTTISIPHKKNEVLDTCSKAYDKIYELSIKDDLSKEELLTLIKLQTEFLNLECSSEYKEVIKKSKQTISEMLKSK
ncbi:MAG: hypothetical protein JNL95_04840 [Chitinophagales bacterium]|nr:hypothetical protein [Chitinophagales bacterium]